MKINFLVVKKMGKNEKLWLKFRVFSKFLQNMLDYFDKGGNRFSKHQKVVLFAYNEIVQSYLVNKVFLKTIDVILLGWQN